MMKVSEIMAASATNMERNGFNPTGKPFFLLGLLLLGLAFPTLAAITPAALRDWHSREVRVAAIAGKILTANTDACSKQTTFFGLLVARLADKSPTDIKAAQTEAFGLGESPTVYVVVPGGPAELVGLRQGDHVLSVDDIAWDVGGVHADNSSFWSAVNGQTRPAVMRLEVQREGRSFPVEIHGQRACAAEVVLVDHRDVYASTTGSRVAINSGLEAFLPQDAELAFVVAHEIAHAILEHCVPGREQDCTDSDLRPRMEIAADALGLLLMAKAGFDPDAAARAEARMAPARRGPITSLLAGIGFELHGPYMRTADRVAYLQKRAAEVRHLMPH